MGRFHPSTPLPAGVDLNEPSHRIKSFEIQNDEFLVAEIEIIDTPSGHALARMWDQGLIEFRPNGYGVINDDKTITDYSIENVSAVLITETVPLTKKVTVKVEFK